MQIEHEWQIRSAKITKKQTVEIRYTQVGEKDGIPENKSNNYGCDRVPHISLFNAFKCLMPHAALVADLVPFGHKVDATYLKSKKAIDDPKFISYSVIGFVLKSDSEGQESVQLTIEKHLNNGGSIKMVLPFVKLHSGSDYEFSGNLNEDLLSVQQECIDYIYGKYRESQQMQIEFEEEQF